MSKLVQYTLIMGILPIVLGVGLHYFFEETNEIKKLVNNIEEVYSRYAQKGEATSFPVLGKPDAPVTIEVYSDFECPFCAQFAKNIVPRLIADYIIPGKAKLVYKYFPLPSHEHARVAAYVAMCANEQGKFWQLHDKIYDNFTNLNNAMLGQLAGEVGLNPAQLDRCIADIPRLDSFLNVNFQKALDRGVRGTPTVFVNGEKVALRDYMTLKKAIEKHL